MWCILLSQLSSFADAADYWLPWVIDDPSHANTGPDVLVAAGLVVLMEGGRHLLRACDSEYTSDVLPSRALRFRDGEFFRVTIVCAIALLLPWSVFQDLSAGYYWRCALHDVFVACMAVAMYLAAVRPLPRAPNAWSAQLQTLDGAA